MNDVIPHGRRLPSWLKRPMPQGAELVRTHQIVRASGVATVCQEARCPNLNECWAHRTATFMILGDKCTRNCSFCAVRHEKPDPPAADEPQRLAKAVAALQLRYVVITAVTRDDLPDEGAGHFAACVRAVRSALPDAGIEVLPADMHARTECIRTICDAGPDVFNHNLETVQRLTPIIRPQADYARSLATLRIAHELNPDLATKSGLMVGLGETEDELKQTFADLLSVSCHILTMGQYLQPSPAHLPIQRFYTPEEFERLADQARAMGFHSVAAGPFVRSSYQAEAVFHRAAK